MSKNIYDNTPESFAKVDSALMKANTAIGESSNLAQLALTYSYNFTDQKIKDAIAILSVLAQISIDSAKRSFDVDFVAEIKRLKKELNVATIGLPLFWFMLKRKNRFIKEKKIDDDPEKRKKMKNLNKSLICPMNHVCEMSFFPEKTIDETIPMEYFFNSYPLKSKRKTSQKLEEFIEKYCTEIVDQIAEGEEINDRTQEEEFEKMIKDLKGCYISEQSIGVMSNLIDRAFRISPKMKSSGTIQSNLWRNKPILLKVLYTLNKNCLLECLNKNLR